MEVSKIAASPLSIVLGTGQLTLESLIDAYIDRHAKKRLRTWRDIKAKLHRHTGLLLVKKLSELTFDDAEQLHIMIGEKGHYAANRVIQHLKSAWNKGVKWGLCQGANPFSGVTLYKEAKRSRHLSDEEVARLIRVLSAYPHEMIKDFIYLSLCTLARKSNVLSMEWTELDLSRGMWTIPESKSKNGEEQVIPLGPFEIELLLKRRHQYGSRRFVFPSKSATGHILYPYKAWRTVCKLAKIDGCRIHDMRRSGGCAMASANINIAIVKSALNHKDIKTTLNVYALANKQSELAARQLVQKQWFG